MRLIPESPLSRRSVMIGAGASIAAGALGLVQPSLGAAPPLGTQAPAWHRFKLGDAECTIVSDGPLSLGEPSGVFKGAPGEELEALLVRNFYPPKVITAEQNVLVINIGGRLILIRDSEPQNCSARPPAVFSRTSRQQESTRRPSMWSA
jgi:hypothetical protein